MTNLSEASFDDLIKEIQKRKVVAMSTAIKQINDGIELLRNAGIEIEDHEYPNFTVKHVFADEEKVYIVNERRES